HRMDERPAKRARLESTDKAHHPVESQGHSFGVINISGSGTVHLGDQHESSKQGFRRNTSDDGVDKNEVLFKSLLFDRIDNRVHTIKKALPRTCQWLFRHKNFKEWQIGRRVYEHNGFLWIKGKPGCGKSTIMKTALEWTRRQVQKQSMKQIILSYFFNGRA